jgi:predicted acetyltransferase
MRVTIQLAEGADIQTIRNMFVAYFYDMAAYDDGIVINRYGLPVWKEFGLPGPQTLDECSRYNWWIRDDCELYTIFVEDTPAGFVVVCRTGPFLPEGIENELMDFYITPHFRRQGIGRIAAKLALDTHRGSWVVYQLKRNTPALSFWHGVIAEYTYGEFEMLDEGAQQRFRNDR